MNLIFDCANLNKFQLLGTWHEISLTLSLRYCILKEILILYRIVKILKIPIPSRAIIVLPNQIPGERDLPTLEGDQLGHLLEQYEDPLRPGLEMAPLELSPRQRSISSQSPSGSEKGERGLTSSLYPHTLDLE